MCFSKKASFIMAICGAISTKIVYNNMNLNAAFCVFYFTLMQIIHYVGYTVIDDCKNKTNQNMSILNYYHICFQAPVWLLGWYGVFKQYNMITPTQLKFMPMLIGLSLVVSFFMTLQRFKWPILPGQKQTPGSKVNDKKEGALKGKLCSYSGKHHIKFRLPLRTEPEYYSPGVSGHFIFFFLPLLFFNNTTRFIGLFTWVTGLLIPTIYYKLNSTEAATVWCYLSITQLAVMYFYIMNNYTKSNI